MAVELSAVIYDVPTVLSGKLQKLSFFTEKHEENENNKENKNENQSENEVKDMFDVYHEKIQGKEQSREEFIKLAEMDTPTSPPPTTTEPYSIQHVTSADYPRVLHHLQRFFFKDEPLNVNISLLDSDGTCVQLEEYSKKCLDHGRSYMAVSQSNEVVGVTVNAVDRPTDVIDAEDCGNPKFQKIINLLATVEREVDIFQRYKDVGSVMNCKLLSVDSNWRGRGIAKQLLDKTREVAREQGQQLMRVDCTSHFSAKAIARLGFECIYTKKYADYEENGEVVFTPELPHTEVAVYVQAITPAPLAQKL